MGAAIDLTGEKFGRLEVVRYERNDIHRRRCWLCRCDCGAEIVRTGVALTTGNTRSCGCLARETTAALKRTHGASAGARYSGFRKSYQTWLNIRRRCQDENSIGWRHYGGRGIRVHEAWLNDYPAFLAYVGEAPKGCTLDRRDTNGHYEPGNVRWATRLEQARNRTDTQRIAFDGRVRRLAEVCEEHGINYASVTAIADREDLTREQVFRQFLDGARKVRGTRRKEGNDDT